MALLAGRFLFAVGELIRERIGVPVAY